MTFTGKECLCQKCVKSREQETPSSPDGNQRHAAANANGNGLHSPAKPSRPQQVQPAAKAAANGGGGAGAPPMDDRCAGCAEDLKDGQALMALDKQYHVWCFKCHSCQVCNSDFVISNFELDHLNLHRCYFTVNTWARTGGLTARGTTRGSSESSAPTAGGSSQEKSSR